MGDVLTLIEKAEATIDEERAKELEKKIIERRGLTLDDFLDQLQQIKNMGSLDQLMDMIPGMTGNFQVDEEQLKRSEAMIRSMTIQERHNPRIINGSRRMRIAKGSGTTVQDVNGLLKQFSQMNRMVRQLTGTGKKRGKKLKRSFPFSFNG
jgi:signal recognition particle subunit SRP54